VFPDEEFELLEAESMKDSLLQTHRDQIAELLRNDELFQQAMKIWSVNTYPKILTRCLGQASDGLVSSTKQQVATAIEMLFQTTRIVDRDMEKVWHKNTDIVPANSAGTPSRPKRVLVSSHQLAS
jgi:hypothetical protein